jgi:subtilisin family serine protease
MHCCLQWWRQKRRWIVKSLKTFAAVVAALALAMSMALPAQAQGRSDLALEALDTHAHMPNELIVQFQPGVSAQGKAQALKRVGGQRQERLVSEAWRRDGKGDLELVRLPPGIGIAAAVRGLEEDASIEFAEPNWLVFHTAASNDPYYTNGSLWGMYGDATTPANPYGSQAGEAWAAGSTNCGSVWVGIIDEGYMYTHEDLAANAGKNPGEIAGNAVDDDANGYVDDVYGWDFDGNNNTVYDGSQDDHGTHVAGTIGGVGGNGKGVAGVCWQVKLMDAKFLGKRGGTTANAIKAVDYFTDLKTRHDMNFVATNNSWGGGGYSQGLYDAIERANAQNILFVAAAGNGGSDGVGDDNDAVPHYPSSYANANIISVAAITSSGAKSGFSNYGATSVDLGAPGSGIYSTLPGGYGSYSGTSMATPHVTGAAALYAAANAGASASQIKNAIMDAAVATSSLSGKTVSGGRLDVSSFVGGGGGGGNVPPTASFTFDCLELACTFSDTSSDDNGVSSWSWDFGDGGSALIQSPSHDFAAAGTYTVVLTVTDNEGAMDTASAAVTVSAAPATDINLTALGRKVKGVMYVDLSWSPTAAGDVDVYRNSALVVTTPNDGSHADGPLGKGSGTFSYQICPADSTDGCSNTVSVVF